MWKSGKQPQCLSALPHLHIQSPVALWIPCSFVAYIHKVGHIRSLTIYYLMNVSETVIVFISARLIPECSKIIKDL